MPAEAGPSCGTRQSACTDESWYIEDETEERRPPLYDGRYYVVVVGRSPGVYRHE